MTSNIIGKFRFLPLKGGGMTLTVDVPTDADIDVMMPECARMFNKDVVISLHQPLLDTPPPAGTVERDALVSARDKVADALAILSEQLGVGEPASNEPPQPTSAPESDEPEQDAPPARLRCDYPVRDDVCIHGCNHAETHDKDVCAPRPIPDECPAGDEQACREVV